MKNSRDFSSNFNLFLPPQMANKQNPNPAITDLREMDVLRFLFELKREQIDPVQLQYMLLDRQIQQQVRALAQQAENRDNESESDSPSPSTSSGGYSSTPSSSRTQDDVPNPNVVFKYTSRSPPSPPNVPIYKNASKPTENLTQERSRFINLKEQSTPSASCSRDSDSDQENLYNNSQLTKLTTSSKILHWRGASIYANLPELVMTEYDKMLRDSHSLKVEVIEALNKEFPVNYEYNPKKSRIRTNYNDPQIADDRTRNNIASRRSRQRKKFHMQMVQYSVDYDTDENFLMEKQEQWLRGIIGNLEQRLSGEQGGISTIKRLRQQCGFD